jgi:hypothetical protein
VIRSSSVVIDAKLKMITAVQKTAGKVKTKGMLSMVKI